MARIPLACRFGNEYEAIHATVDAIGRLGGMGGHDQATRGGHSPGDAVGDVRGGWDGPRPPVWKRDPSLSIAQFSTCRCSNEVG